MGSPGWTLHPPTQLWVTKCWTLAWTQPKDRSCLAYEMWFIFFFWMSCQYLKMRDSSTSLDFWFFSWKMGLSDNFGLDFSQGNSWLEPSSGYSLWAAKASLPSFTSFMLLFWPHRHFQFGAPDLRLFTPSPAYLSPTSHRSGCPPLPLSLFVYLNTFHFVSQRTWSWLYEINIIK